MRLQAFTDERGLLIAARPRRLIVPPALMFTADRLLETTQRVGTADNDINAIRNMGAIPEGYSVNHYLTDSNAFFLITDVPNGMKHVRAYSALKRLWMETSTLVTCAIKRVSVTRSAYLIHWAFTDRLAHS